ncbi:MAG: MlaD family protein [Ferruginibacter sp.]
MKISNETKVGALAVVGITLLILGFNFLKGNSLFNKSTVIYGNYTDIAGLTPSNPVIINGMQVGTVGTIEPSKDMRSIMVAFNINRDINIPSNSVAMITPNPLGITKVEIKLGNASNLLKNKDTINTQPSEGLLEDVMKKVDPVLYQVNKSLGSLDSLLTNVNSVVDSKAKKNISDLLDNLKLVTASMVVSAASLQQMLDKETGSLAKSMNNVSSITGNLASNNDKISHMMTNLDQTTGKLAQLDLQKTLATLDSTLQELKDMTSKMNNGQGSIGLLMNDPSLYRNLASTGNKLNLLLDDLRVNPKRYLSISVFGKKTKSQPLMVPLPDTLSSPYIIEKSN